MRCSHQGGGWLFSGVRCDRRWAYANHGIPRMVSGVHYLPISISCHLNQFLVVVFFQDIFFEDTLNREHPTHTIHLNAWFFSANPPLFAL